MTDLFAYARATDPRTSHEAADAVTPRLSALEERCLNALRDAGAYGLTSKELALWTRLDRVTVSPRLRPLAERGLIRATEDRRDGGIVWVVCDA